jgi:hypothetical protein
MDGVDARSFFLFADSVVPVFLFASHDCLHPERSFSCITYIVNEQTKMMTTRGRKIDVLALLWILTDVVLFFNQHHCRRHLLMVSGPAVVSVARAFYLQPKRSATRRTTFVYSGTDTNNYDNDTNPPSLQRPSEPRPHFASVQENEGEENRVTTTSKLPLAELSSAPPGIIEAVDNSDNISAVVPPQEHPGEQQSDEDEDDNGDDVNLYQYISTRNSDSDDNSDSNETYDSTAMTAVSDDDDDDSTTRPPLNADDNVEYGTAAMNNGMSDIKTTSSAWSSSAEKEFLEAVLDASVEGSLAILVSSNIFITIIS